MLSDGMRGAYERTADVHASEGRAPRVVVAHEFDELLLRAPDVRVLRRGGRARREERREARQRALAGLLRQCPAVLVGAPARMVGSVRAARMT